MATDGEGASQSLNLTISELMDFLGDHGPRPSSFDGQLRDFLHEKISDLAVRAFKAGYKQAHQDCVSEYRKGKGFPLVLFYDARPRLSPRKVQSFRFESRIPKR